MELFSPTTGQKRQELVAFLRESGLSYDEGITHTVILRHEQAIVATGSIQGNVIKCVAVSPAHRGEGYLADIMTKLHSILLESGVFHYYLYTKTENYQMFTDMGFHLISQTHEVLFMENKKGGITSFLREIKQNSPVVSGCVGAVVMHCNPFTLGHQFLVETASASCDLLYIFVLSANQSTFSAEKRRKMVEDGTAHLTNVSVHGTGDYLISQATFPTYFLKDPTQAIAGHCQLDLQIFGEHIAPTLGISRRFVGTETACQVTRAYNRFMKEILPSYGVEVLEIPRKIQGEQEISASRVRALLEELNALIPETTWRQL